MTFRTPPANWDRNTGPGRATRAIIQDPTGKHHQGVRIRQESTGGWFVLTEANAIDLANQIVDVIEYRKSKEAK